MFGIAITNYDEIYQDIYTINNTRNGTFAGIEIGSKCDNIKYLMPQILNKNDSRHKIAKDIANILCQSGININHHNKQCLLPNNYLNEYWNVSALKSYHTIGVLHYAVHLYFILGAVLTKHELKILEYIGKKALFITFPDWLHFLFGYNYSGRCFYDIIQKMKVLFIKYGNLNSRQHRSLNKYQQVIQYCNKYNINVDIGLNCCAMLLIVPGGRSFFSKAIHRYKINSKLEKKMFKTKPINYLYELLRHNSTLPTTSQLTLTKRRYIIDNKQHTFPVNTMICSSVGAINHINSKFDCNRTQNQYRKCIIFHSIENGYYDKQDLSPRYCPGHDLGFIYLYAIVTKLHNMNMHDTVDKHKEKTYGDVYVYKLTAKVFYMTMYIILFIGSVLYVSNIYHLFSSLATFFTVSFILFYFDILLFANNLCHHELKYKLLHGSMNYVSDDITINKHKPICSISMSAHIDNSRMQKLFSLFINCGCMVIISAASSKLFDVKLNYKLYDIKQLIAIYFLLSAGCGGIIFTTFNVYRTYPNKSNMVTQYLHYFGVFLFAILGNLSFLLYNNANFTSVMLFTSTLLILTIYKLGVFTQESNDKTLVNDEEISKWSNKMSKINIVFELLAVIPSAVAICSVVYQFGNE
eukprot:413369_1